MTIVRWNPFRDVAAFEDRMSRMLEGSSSSRFQADLARSAWVPAVDIYSNGPYQVVLKAELPDMKQGRSR